MDDKSSYLSILWTRQNLLSSLNIFVFQLCLLVAVISVVIINHIGQKLTTAVIVSWLDSKYKAACVEGGGNFISFLLSMALSSTEKG